MVSLFLSTPPEGEGSGLSLRPSSLNALRLGRAQDVVVLVEGLHTFGYEACQRISPFLKATKGTSCVRLAWRC